MLYIINAFSGNVNVLSANILFSHRIIIETEVIRAVAGLPGNMFRLLANGICIFMMSVSQT